MTSEQIYNIIRKYFFGQLTEDGEKIVGRWLASDDSQAEKETAMGKIWEETKTLADDNTYIEEQLNAFHSRRDEHERRMARRRTGMRIMKYAAAVVLPIVCMVATWIYAGRYYSSAMQTVECRVPDGATRTLTLADGSRVVVNGGSSILYPRQFGRTEERRVYISGEVHFDVSHDESRPFVVNADGVRVKVLGTHFNVRAYADEPAITTTLEQGCVQVESGGKAVVLKPNEQAVCLRSTGKLTKLSVQAEKVRAWTSGGLDFDNQPLSLILRTVSHKYGVRFDVAGDIDLNRKYNMSFDDSEKLADVLGIIAAVSGNVGYSYKGETVRLWKKQKGGNR